jgi:hypothetical protein
MLVNSAQVLVNYWLFAIAIMRQRRRREGAARPLIYSTIGSEANGAGKSISGVLIGVEIARLLKDQQGVTAIEYALSLQATLELVAQVETQDS